MSAQWMRVFQHPGVEPEAALADGGDHLGAGLVAGIVEHSVAVPAPEVGFVLGSQERRWRGGRTTRSVARGWRT